MNLCMKTHRLLPLAVAGALFQISLASAQTQIVTLTTRYGVGNTNVQANLAVEPHQIVALLYANGKTNGICCELKLTNGITVRPLLPPAGSSFQQGQMTLTGVTNIFICGDTSEPSAFTFSITTPSQSSPSQLPANSVVIPTDATGPVQIVLESSSDLVSWNAALPGSYGNTYSNRFFRVRAVANP